MIKNLIEKKTPFAVFRYYENLKCSDVSNPRYELIYLDNANEKVFKRVENYDLIYFNAIKSKFDMKVSDDSGTVWEMFNFKAHYDKQKELKAQQKKQHKNHKKWI